MTLTITDLFAGFGGGGSDARLASDPLSTITAGGNHHGLLTPYCGNAQSGRSVDDAIGTLTTVDRYALIEPDELTAAESQVDDCLFRMLEPHEVGAGMAFDRNYIVMGSRRNQVKGYGNAVTPPAARDLIGAVVEAYHQIEVSAA